MDKAKLIDIFKFLISLFTCQFAGFIGSLFTTPAIPIWYACLKKPTFAPPNSVFGPVWITLFALMGISAFLIWRRGLNDPLIKAALIVFIMQLLFNILWSITFFGMKLPLVGLIDIVILWVFILLTIKSFLKISKIAGLLLVPYLLWVSFATVLNFFLWRLNI